MEDFHVGHEEGFGVLELRVHARHGGEKFEIIFPADRGLCAGVRNHPHRLGILSSELSSVRSVSGAAHKEINQKILDELLPAVCNRIKKNLPRDLTKVGQKELLNQFLNADASLK